MAKKAPPEPGYLDVWGMWFATDGPHRPLLMQVAKLSPEDAAKAEVVIVSQARTPDPVVQVPTPRPRPAFRPRTLPPSPGANQ